MQNPVEMLSKLGADKSGPKPSVPYWHLWTDESGISHQVQCALTKFELKGVGGADPQWNNQARDPLLDGGDHRAAGGLGRRLAREPGAAMDRRAVRALVDREHGWHPHRAGTGRVLVRRGSGLHRDGGQERASVRHDRRPAGGADDGAAAHRSAPHAVPCHLTRRAAQRLSGDHRLPAGDGGSVAPVALLPGRARLRRRTDPSRRSARDEIRLLGLRGSGPSSGAAARCSIGSDRAVRSARPPLSG